MNEAHELLRRMIGYLDYSNKEADAFSVEVEAFLDNQETAKDNSHLERLARIMITFDLATGHADTMDELLDSLESELRDVLGYYREALKNANQEIAKDPAGWPIAGEIAKPIARKYCITYEVVQLIAREILRSHQLNQETAKDNHEWGCRANAFGECNCKRKDEVVEINTLARACNLAGIAYKDFLKIKAYMPIHPAKPERKPMTEEEMRKAWGDPAELTQQCLIDYCRAIEKHHGITEDHND